MSIKITIAVREADRKWTPSLMGYINVWENDNFLWQKTTGIKRLTKKDALQDAENLKKEILDENGYVEVFGEFINKIMEGK